MPPLTTGGGRKQEVKKLQLLCLTVCPFMIFHLLQRAVQTRLHAGEKQANDSLTSSPFTKTFTKKFDSSFRALVPKQSPIVTYIKHIFITSVLKSCITSTERQTLQALSSAVRADQNYCWKYWG